jgi:hypothetical protein
VRCRWLWATQLALAAAASPFALAALALSLAGALTTRTLGRLQRLAVFATFTTLFRFADWVVASIFSERKIEDVSLLGFW